MENLMERHPQPTSKVSHHKHERRRYTMKGEFVKLLLIVLVIVIIIIVGYQLFIALDGYHLYHFTL